MLEIVNLFDTTTSKGDNTICQCCVFSLFCFCGTQKSINTALTQLFLLKNQSHLEFLNTRKMRGSLKTTCHVLYLCN